MLDLQSSLQAVFDAEIKFEVVPAAGVEPATFRSGGERSNPLSYAGLNKMACFKEVHKNVPLFNPFLYPSSITGVLVLGGFW